MAKNKIPIQIKDLPIFYSQYQTKAKQGDSMLESLQCIFMLQNDSLIYLYPIFDFLDLSIEIRNKIISFFLIQSSD